jgi:hypothetical protein
MEPEVVAEDLLEAVKMIIDRDAGTTA